MPLEQDEIELIEKVRSTPKAKTIAKKNDFLRQNLLCQLVVTKSVAESPNFDIIIERVRTFKNFYAGNDPYGEHDFGAFDVTGIKYFWKIDYVDEEGYFKEDGKRILTIMQANEY